MRPIPFTVLCLGALAGGCAGAPATAPAVAGGAMLLVNARVVTLDPERPVAAAVAIAGGRIACVGDEAACASVVPGARRIDVAGAAVVPGLVDAHAHVLSLGSDLVDLDLSAVRGEQELVALVARRAQEDAAAGRGGWLRGRGWDQNDWSVQAFPSNVALSAAVPDRPVWLTRVDGHAGLANAAALRAAGVGKDTADPPGGRILRDASGAPTGVLVDNAMELVSRAIPSLPAEERRSRLLAALRRCAELGFTGIHDMGVDRETLRLYEELDGRGELALRIYALVDGADEPALRAYLPRGPVRGRRLVVRAAKLFLDGALGSRGAALFDDYSDDPGNRGLDLLTPDEFRERASRIHAAGYQVAVHAIGDRANAAALDGFAAAGIPAAARPRIEHAQVMRPDDIARAARMGVVASMQPTHATSDMPWAPARLGPSRLAGAYAWRSFLRAGAHLALGSDFPVEEPSPMLGLYASITRQDAAGQPPGGFLPDQKLTGLEALRGFTEGSAWAAFEEGVSGRLAAGRRADLTVLNVDPTTAAPAELLKARALLTIVDGVVVHDGR